MDRSLQGLIIKILY